MKTNLKWIAFAAIAIMAGCQKAQLTDPQLSERLEQSNIQGVTINAVTTSYYVDNLSGNDANSGTSSSLLLPTPLGFSVEGC